MILKLSPIRSDISLAVAKSGDVLTINGVALDFSRLEPGSTLPAAAVGSDFIIAPVERTGTGLVITLMLPHGEAAPEAVRFPADLAAVPDGQVRLPTGIVDMPPPVPGVIDWSQVITAEAKAKAAAEQLLAVVVGDTAQRRAAADAAIAPLQDAVDIDEATEDEASLLKEWKRYRVALNRLPEQPGYPAEIDWPAPPA
ncbi:tail fiber assembly protein [Pseudomonas sp. 148P]|uniref:Tail fiber assembly protein n=1 Tax=Pseudomonas ulcerans TaxID=3115852 RepID=A0ABU7HQ49_9PSED|nr:MULTISPECIES: tail fiber assembly protein [unclassified Pseudomonas]MEE1922694.1 tail fiber assembly protein [Pseudomonas sp. 147P]MEE1933671.1 tail fiber assembly protein [Pseudomonas sp. 148P]